MADAGGAAAAHAIVEVLAGDAGRFPPVQRESPTTVAGEPSHLAVCGFVAGQGRPARRWSETAGSSGRMSGRLSSAAALKAALLQGFASSGTS